MLKIFNNVMVLDVAYPVAEEIVDKTSLLIPGLFTFVVIVALVIVFIVYNNKRDKEGKDAKKQNKLLILLPIAVLLLALVIGLGYGIYEEISMERPLQPREEVDISTIS